MFPCIRVSSRHSKFFPQLKYYGLGQKHTPPIEPQTFHNIPVINKFHSFVTSNRERVGAKTPFKGKEYYYGLMVSWTK